MPDTVHVVFVRGKLRVKEVAVSNVHVSRLS
jgi:hypothetical protein